MTSCLFCKIATKQIPSSIVFEDENILAFEDINPVSPLHILIITKKHYKNILEIPSIELPAILNAVKKIARDSNIDQTGFRLVNNCGDDGGQEVGHIHFHLLGKRTLTWPPG